MLRQAHQPSPSPSGRGSGSIVNPTAYDRFPTPQRQAWLSQLQSKINRGLSGLPPSPGPSRSPSPSQGEAGPSNGLTNGLEGQVDEQASDRSIEHASRGVNRDAESLDEDEDGWPEVDGIGEPQWADEQEAIEDDELEEEEPDMHSLIRDQQRMRHLSDEPDEGYSAEAEGEEGVQFSDEEDDLDRRTTDKEGESDLDAAEEEDKHAREHEMIEVEEPSEDDEVDIVEGDEIAVGLPDMVGAISQLQPDSLYPLLPPTTVVPELGQVDKYGFATIPGVTTLDTSPSIYPPLPQATPLDTLLSNVDPSLMSDAPAQLVDPSAMPDLSQIDPQVLADIVQSVSDQAWNIDTFPPTDETQMEMPPLQQASQQGPVSENPFASFTLPSPSPLPPPPLDLPNASASMSREPSGSSSRRDVIEFIDSDDDEEQEPVEPEMDEDVEFGEADEESETEEEEESDDGDLPLGPVVVEELEGDDEMPESVEPSDPVEFDEIDDEEEEEEEADAVDEPEPPAMPDQRGPVTSATHVDAAGAAETEPSSDPFNSTSTRSSDDDHLPFLLRKGNLRSPLDKTHGLPVLEQADAAYRASIPNDSALHSERVQQTATDIAAHIITTVRQSASDELPTNIPFGEHTAPVSEVPHSELLSIPSAEEEAEQVQELADSPTPPPLPHLRDFTPPEDVEMVVDEVLIPAAPVLSFETESPLDDKILEFAESVTGLAVPVDPIAALPDPSKAPPPTMMLSPLDPHHLEPHPDPTPSLIVEPPQNPPSPSSVQPYVPRPESPVHFPDPQEAPPDTTRAMPLSPGDMRIDKPLTPSLIVEPPLRSADTSMEDVVVSALPTPATEQPNPVFADIQQTGVTVITPGLELRMEAFDAEGDAPVIAEMDGADDNDPAAEALATPPGEMASSEVEAEEPVENEPEVEEVEPEEPIESTEGEQIADIDQTNGSREVAEEEGYAQEYIRLRHRHGTHDHTEDFQRQVDTSADVFSPPITRSHCFYTKLGIRDGNDRATVLVPQCVIGDVQKLAKEHAESDGIATDEEEQLAMTQVISHSTPLLVPALATKLHRIAGERLYDAGHCYLLQASEGALQQPERIPSTEPEEEVEGETQVNPQLVEKPKPTPTTQRQTRSSIRMTQSISADSVGTEVAAPSVTPSKGRTPSKSVDFDLPVEGPPVTPTAPRRGRGRPKGSGKRGGPAPSASAASVPPATTDSIETLPTIAEKRERRKSTRSSSKAALPSPQVDAHAEEDSVARHTRSSATPGIPSISLDTPAEEVERIIAMEETIPEVDIPPMAENITPQLEIESSQTQGKRRSGRRSHAEAVDEAPYRPATPSDDDEPELEATLPPKSPRSPRKTGGRRKDAATPIKNIDFESTPASSTRTRKRKHEDEADAPHEDQPEDVDMTQPIPEPAKRETRSAKKRAVEQETAPDVSVADAQPETGELVAANKAKKPKSTGKKEELKPDVKAAQASETPQRKTRSSWLSGWFSSSKKK